MTTKVFIKSPRPNHQALMASIAITHLQTAQMFAVKALTWRG